MVKKKDFNEMKYTGIWGYKNVGIVKAAIEGISKPLLYAKA